MLGAKPGCADDFIRLEIWLGWDGAGLDWRFDWAGDSVGFGDFVRLQIWLDWFGNLGWVGDLLIRTYSWVGCGVRLPILLGLLGMEIWSSWNWLVIWLGWRFSYFGDYAELGIWLGLEIWLYLSGDLFGFEICLGWILDWRFGWVGFDIWSGWTFGWERYLAILDISFGFTFVGLEIWLGWSFGCAGLT